MTIRFLAALVLVVACSTQTDRIVPQDFDASLIATKTSEVPPGPGTVAHSENGVPTFTWGDELPPAVLAERSKMSHEAAARAYLGDYATRFRLGRSLATTATLKDVHDLGDGPVIVRFKQQGTMTDVHGVARAVDVFRDEMKLLMRRDHSLVAIAGNAREVPQELPKAQQKEEDAIAFALEDLTGVAHDAETIAQLGAAGGYTRYAIAEGLFAAQSSFRVRPVLFPTEASLEAAYYVELEVATELSAAEAYAYVISAVDGRLLFRKNLVDFDAQFRVYADTDGTPLDSPEGDAYVPHPTGQLDGVWPATTVEARLVTPAFADKWIADGVTTLDGNNAHAYADTAEPNGLAPGDVEINESATGVWDYAFDPSLSADASLVQIKAATTNMFYIVNFLHDWFYDAGFTEAAGNAQKDNYGRGGLGEDAMLVEGQDFSGRNNANMATYADGKAPRMQMYLNDTPSLPTLLLEGTQPIAIARLATVPFAPVKSAPALGMVELVADGCAALPAVAGRFVLVEWGACELRDVAAAVEAASGKGLIVIAKAPITTRQISADGDEVGIPVVVIDPTTGATLKQKLTAGEAVFATAQRGAPADRDAAFESATVSHEWGHYLTNRLVGDAAGLSSKQARSMGEGWGDFISLLVTVREADALLPSNTAYAGVYPVFAYTSTFDTTTDIYYRGLRRAPYSTDFAVNPLTFKHVQNGVALPPLPQGYNFGEAGTNNSEVHSAGEVWAVMLWECYVALLNDTSRGLTFAEKQARMKRYLVESLKMTPNAPTFLEARDAVLAAAIATDEVDYDLFWHAFAKRGAGVRAVAPPRASTDFKGVFESFVVGPDLAITSATISGLSEQCTADGILDNGEHAVLTVTVKNVGSGSVTPIAIVGSPTNGMLVDNAGMMQFPTLTPMKSASATIMVRASTLQPLALVDLVVTATAPNLLAGGVTQTVSFAANFDTQLNASANDDVEAPQSAWTPAHVVAEDFENVDFVRVAETASQTVWRGADADGVSDVTLTSPALVVSATDDFTVKLKHSFAFEKSGQKAYDGGVIELSTDGTTWVDVGAQATPGYGGKIEKSDMNPLSERDAYVGKSATTEVTLAFGKTYVGQTVYLRFRIGTDEGVGAAGWTIDDVRITGITNTPFSTRAPNTCP